MTDFWDNWSGGSREAMPAGDYTAQLENVEIRTNNWTGAPETSLTFRLCPDQAYANKVLWYQWDMDGENAERFGWKARNVYEVMGFTSRPAGETVGQVMQSIADALRTAIGKVVTLQVICKTKNEGQPDEVKKNYVNRIAPFRPNVAAPPAGAYQGGQPQANVNNGLAGLQAYANGPAPQPNPAAQPSPYGGEGYAAAQAQQGQNGGRPW